MRQTLARSAAREQFEDFGGELGAEKIQAWHRERLAVVYVRQSTGQQVRTHQESARLQYELTARAQALGWAADRVAVIDADQGQSGSQVESRTGFPWLVSAVSFGQVGIILGRETSR